jgi:tetratricopeptide (TPR) repeat protein
MSLEGPEGAELWLDLADIAAAASWHEAAAIVDRRPDLLRDEVRDLLVGAGGGALQQGEGDAAEVLLQLALLLDLARDSGAAGAVQELVARDAEKTVADAATLSRLRVEGIRRLREIAIDATRVLLSTSGPGGEGRMERAAAAWARLVEHREFPRLPPDLVAMTASEASPVLWLAVIGAGDLRRLETLVRCHSIAAAVGPERSPERGDALTGLGRALTERYRRTGQAADLDDAIAAYDGAVELVPESGVRSDVLRTWDRWAVLDEAGNARRDRYSATGDPADLEAARMLHEHAVAGCPPDTPELMRYLNDLGNDRRLMFQRSGDAADLEAAIDAHERALAIPGTDDGGRAQLSANLGNEIRDRYELSGGAADLERAIALHEAAIDATSPDTPWSFLHALSIDLSKRYRRTAIRDDSEQSMQLLRRALARVDSRDPGRPMVLMDIGVGLMDRYQRTGDVADVEGAASAFAEAVNATPPGSPYLPTRLLNLGLAMHSRHRDNGDEESLDAALETLRRAAALPAGKQERASILANLGLVLSDHYALTGAADELEEAVGALEQADALAAPEAPERAWIGMTLGSALRTRYARTTSLDDLDRATAALRAALDATPPEATDWPDRVNQFGNALLTRYRLSDRISDLEEAIAGLEEAVRLIPETSPKSPPVLTTLGALLGERHRSPHAHEDDAVRALALVRRAVDNTPVGSRRRPRRLSTLGALLIAWYISTGRPRFLDSALDALRQAVDGAADSADLAMFLRNLGEGYRMRYDERRDPEDLASGVETLRRCCRLALETDVESALSTARSWGDWASARDSWPEAAEAYGLALEAAHRAFGIQLVRADKETWLKEAHDLPALAAHAYVASGDRRSAVVALERGRALLLSEVLELGQADVRALGRGATAELAQRYKAAAERWLRVSSEHLEPEPALSALS